MKSSFWDKYEQAQIWPFQTKSEVKSLYFLFVVMYRFKLFERRGFSWSTSSKYPYYSFAIRREP